MLPAVGQGALCIEIRENDPRIGPIVGALDHPPTHTVVRGERAFLKRLEGGCQVPIAAHGMIDNDQFFLTGLVSDVDGTTIIRESLAGTLTDAKQIGIDLAERLLKRGAREILDSIYSAEQDTPS